MRRRRTGIAAGIGIAAALTATSLIYASPAALAEPGTSSDVPNVVSRQETAATTAAAPGRWTAEEMRAAKPYPALVADDSSASATSTEDNEPQGIPGFSRATPPDDIADAENANASTSGDESGSVSGAGVQPMHSFNPDSDYPGPYQRWTYFGRYTTWPVSTVAKMFFNQDHDANGSYSSFVCSAEVMGNRAVHTAGHCVHNGRNGAGAGGGWSTSILICPSYNASGVNPSVGCWSVTGIGTSGSWFTNGNPNGFDRDWGAVQTATTGTVHNTTIGSRTGALGSAWNWGHRAVVTFGYPAGSPFPGHHIVTCSAPHWYNRDMGPGANSVYIGCDKTGGTSGGPWILGLEHPNSSFNYGGFNSSKADIGGGNWLYGVHSHRRTANLEELASPPFTSEAGGWLEFRDWMYANLN